MLVTLEDCDGAAAIAQHVGKILFLLAAVQPRGFGIYISARHYYIDEIGALPCHVAISSMCYTVNLYPSLNNNLLRGYRFPTEHHKTINTYPSPY